MLRSTWLRTLMLVLLLFLWTCPPRTFVLAQTVADIASSDRPLDTTDTAGITAEGEWPLDEASLLDLGGHRLFLPLISGSTGNTVNPTAATQAARWQRTVLEFGAIPDDNQDDTAAMQKAADFLCTHPGYTLVYPPGLYNLERLVNLDTEVSGLTTDKAITYQNCNNVKILGIGANLQVKGNFTKRVDRLLSGMTPPPLCRGGATALDFIPCVAVGEANLFQWIPFAFVNSQHFVLSGFEIDGNVDQMKQADPTVYLQERSEYGVLIIDSHDFVLERLFVHHMATDGITFPSRPGSDHGKIDRVVSANNTRMALTIAGPVRNLEVVNTVLRDSGVVGTATDLFSYTAHAPGRGVDIETECLPANADWGVATLRVAGCRLTGNILFDRVRATGSIGGQIAFPHGESAANITVRRSFLQNSIGRGGTVINLGVAGGVVEDSILDAQLGYVDPCRTAGDSAQLTSPIFAGYLAELANDPASVAKRIAHETRSFSSTLRRNTIRGQNSLLVCESALPFLTIEGNKFEGAQPVTVPAGSFYTLYGYLWLVGGACDSGRGWARDIQFRRNTLLLPNRAPRRDTGVIVYCGNIEHLQDNIYTTDAGALVDPITVRYDHVGTVVNDCFPNSKLSNRAPITPIHGYTRTGDPPDYPAFQPYTLSSTHCLNLP